MPHRTSLSIFPVSVDLIGSPFSTYLGGRNFFGDLGDSTDSVKPEHILILTILFFLQD